MKDNEYLSFSLLRLFTAFALFFLALSAKNDYTKGDSRLNLLTSQAILEKGTVKLDDYLPDSVRKNSIEASWVLYAQNGHWYNLYPTGTSLFSLPYVASMEFFRTESGR